MKTRLSVLSALTALLLVGCRSTCPAGHPYQWRGPDRVYTEIHYMDTGLDRSHHAVESEQALGGTVGLSFPLGGCETCRIVAARVD